jgi:hypothetical protein
MSRNSKIEFLFDHQFRGLKSLRKRCAITLLLDDANAEKIAERMFVCLNSSNGPSPIKYSIIRSLKNFNLFEEEMLDGRHIKSASTILLWIKAAINYRQMLNELPDEGIDKRFDEIRAEQLQDEAAVDEEEFFNHHDADADFDYWLEMACWKPEEAVALSMGKDPKVVNTATLNKELEERMNETAAASQSVFFREYLKRCEQVNRAQEIGRLPENITPSAFLEWANGQKMALDGKLAESLVGFADPNSNSSSHQNENLHGKTRGVFLKIIFGLAISHYDQSTDLYSREHTDVARRISDDLRLTGIDVDEKTVRKYLKDASEYLIGQDIKLKTPSASNRSNRTQ